LCTPPERPCGLAVSSIRDSSFSLSVEPLALAILSHGAELVAVQLRAVTPEFQS
jgi:hypothetical protein